MNISPNSLIPPALNSFIQQACDSIKKSQTTNAGQTSPAEKVGGSKDQEQGCRSKVGEPALQYAKNDKPRCG